MKKRILLFLVIFCLLSVNACALDSTDISAECAVLISQRTGEIIFEKNAQKRHSMASTTKIMTALLAIESGRLGDEITVTEDMLRVEGTSMGLLSGDSVSQRELVYGMLLASGNDAANVTAIHLGGNVESFASQMNQKAAQLGMKSTNFVTPSGLDDDEHYSTAYDMALLGRYAVSNPIFRSICSAKKANLTYGNPPYVRTLYNHNRLLSSYEYALGIKTGFTKKSGRCLVSYAEKDGIGLIAVTLNAPNDWTDHQKMLDYGFSVMNTKEIFADIPPEIDVVGGNVENLPLKCNAFKYDYVNELPVTKELTLEKFVYAPVKKGDKIGEIKFYYNGLCIGMTDIVADSDVAVKQQEKQESKNLFTKIKERMFND